MTDLKILAVKNSWSYIIFQSEEVSALFYNKLFELDPSLRPLFRGNIEEQGKKLMDMLTMIVARLQRMQDIAGEVKNLGQRHVGYGTKPEHYQTVGKALLWSLENALGDHWNMEMHEAWTEAYALMANTMLQGAQTSAQPVKVL
jgi:hemoglobin-like flavoprotein